MSEKTSIVNAVANVADGVLRIYSLFDMGKSLIEIYKDKNNTLMKSFIKAFEQAVDEVSEQYENDSIKSFLENCREIEDVLLCEDLYEYLCRKNNDREVPLNDSDVADISKKITEQLNCIVLNDNEYKDLYNIFSYYQLNSTSFKLDKMNDIIQEFIKLMSDSKDLRTDNELFARAYKERLFMHSVGDISISLSDIFVMPDVRNKNGRVNALEAIRNFVNDRNQHVFFLEGFGGYGKSSIVSYLAYNYLFNRSSPKIDFLDNRQLVIIRLRDIDSSNIIKSMIEKLNNVGKLSKNAVLIFDGLDELCLIENKSDGNSISEAIISTFVKDSRKVIITSRPTYIKYEELKLASNIKCLHTELVAFDEGKRKKFVDLFTRKDKNHPLTAKYIKELNVYNDNDSIYGSPFLLYLIISGGIEENEKDNSWKLLHRIFYEEMFKPKYNPSVRPLREYDIDKIYQYNCDIAYEMFKTQNRKLSFTYDELEDLLPEYSHEEYVKKSHGLFSYMRYNNGAVEFVHNNVRDFLLCEKILITICKWYKNDYSSEKIAIELCNLLKYHTFEKQVSIFISEALENDYNIISDKCTPAHLHNFFDLLHNAGGMISYDYFKEAENNTTVSFYDLSKNVIGNASYIYKTIYLNKKTSNIKWFSTVKNTAIIDMMKDNLMYASLSNVQLVGKSLRNLNLKGIHLDYANLSNADLSGANLSDADLSNANLSGANLSGADLSNANLSKAKLIYTNLSNANLSGAILNGAYLHRVGLINADLRNAYLFDTHISETNIFASIHDCTRYNKKTTFPNDFNPCRIYWIYME